MLCSDLLPAITPTDEFGQQTNIYALAQRISQQCGTQAQVLSYAGIMTYPPQSEIKVSFTENGNTYSTVLDICTNQQHMMYLMNMHE